MFGAVIFLVVVVRFFRLIGWLLQMVGRLLTGEERSAQRRAAQTQRLRAAQEAERIRSDRMAERAEARAERLRAQRIRQAERDEAKAERETLRADKAAERVREAQADLEHLDRLRSDLRKLADYAEQMERDADTEAKLSKAISKRIALDQKLRNVDRRREQLQSVISLGGR